MNIANAAVWLALFALLAFPADAQDAGEPYHSLMSPSGSPCCGAADCAAYPEGAYRYGENGLELFYKNAWLPVPDDAILPQGSWDGQMHACVVEGFGWRGGQPVPKREVRCVLLPGMAALPMGTQYASRG